MAGTSSKNVLDSVHDLIDRKQYREALEQINRSAQRSPAMENARAVCLLRMGNPEQAARILRELVFPVGSMCISLDAPAAHQANYVAAMLLLGNVQAARGVLDDIQDRNHPAVLRLKAALSKWQKGLSLPARVLCLLRVYPHRPVELDQPVGDL